MVIQKIDKEILEFIDRFHCVTTTHIVKEFYSKHKQGRFIVNRKMGKLVEKKLVKRDRELFQDYVYYFKKTIQQQHHLIVADFYFKLKECDGRLLEYDVEVVMDGLRPDAVVKYELNGDIYLFCIEVHRSNNGADIEKYERLYMTGLYKEYLEWFPVVVFISDKKINIENIKLPFVVIKTDLSDFEKIFI